MTCDLAEHLVLHLLRLALEERAPHVSWRVVLTEIGDGVFSVIAEARGYRMRRAYSVKQLAALRLDALGMDIPDLILQDFCSASEAGVW